MDRRKRVKLLLEVLMSSVNLNKVPVDVGWSVWRIFSTNRLFSDEGLRILIRACKYCEPEKTRKVLKGESV